MKIVITGVTGFRNRGVEALVRPIIRGLWEVFPEANFTIVSGSPDFDAPRLKQNRISVEGEGPLSPVASGRKRRFAERLHLVATRNLRYNWPQLQGAELIVVTGGDIYSSEYGDWSFERHLVPLRVAIQEKIPFVIFSQSIGPFTKEKHKSNWLEVAQNASLISVRESRTFKYLTENLNLDTKIVRSVADPAFLLEPDMPACEIAKPFQPDSKKLVAISISQGIAQWTGVDREIWLGTWVEIVQRIVKNWGVKVILIPHVQEPYANDIVACTEVWRRIAFSRDVTVLGQDLTAGEYKAAIGNCSMVVAERMHAGIAGLSSGVCTAIVAYSVKARGVLEEILGTELANSGAILEGEDFRNIEQVWSKLDHLWRQRQEISNHINQRLPNIKKLARDAFLMLNEVIKK